MKTSTNKALARWRNTYAPKNLNVNVSAWLKENKFSQQDIETVKKDATFADFKSCIEGKSEHGLDIIDTERMMDQFCEGFMDSFLRDAIFDAINEID